MTEGTAAAAAAPVSPPTLGGNLQKGLWSSPATKMKALVALGIVAAIGTILVIGSKKKDEPVKAVEHATVAVGDVPIAKENPGAANTNPEVDKLIQQVEKGRASDALEQGETYVPPAPNLEQAPPLKESAPGPTVTYVSQAEYERKLAALQGLDGKLGQLGETKVAEKVFERPSDSDKSSTNVEGLTTKKSEVKRYPSGTTWYATLLTAVDSEVPGPVKVRIEQGPYSGGEVLGNYQVVNNKYVSIIFTRLVFENREIPVQAIGVDPHDMKGGLAGNVNHHWVERLLLPTVAAALGAYAQSATFGGSTTLSAAGATIQQPTLTSAERLQYALGSGVTQGVTPVLQQEAQQIHTQVTVNPGTALGVMLTEGL